MPGAGNGDLVLHDGDGAQLSQALDDGVGGADCAQLLEALDDDVLHGDELPAVEDTVSDQVGILALLENGQVLAAPRALSAGQDELETVWLKPHNQLDPQKGRD